MALSSASPDQIIDSLREIILRDDPSRKGSWLPSNTSQNDPLPGFVVNIIYLPELNDKGEAIALLVSRYIEEADEPELRPEFIEKMRKIEKQKSIRVKDFAKRYGLKNV